MKKTLTKDNFKRLRDNLLQMLVPGVVITIGCLLLYKNQKPMAISHTPEEKKFTPVTKFLPDDTTAGCPTFERIQNPARFPHGINAWRKYLEKNLVYPQAAINHNTEGIVRVQMTVEKDGSISHVFPLNDPGYGLAEEAVRMIKSGPGWIPARHHGKPVIYRLVQTVTFQLK